MSSHSNHVVSILRFAILIFLNLLIIGAVSNFYGGSFPAGSAPLAAQALSRRGDRGEEVRQIQQKLSEWGYYTGSVDGIYGEGTEQAVRSFQRKNGLTVDGIAGKATLEAMGIQAGASSETVSTGGSGLGGYSDSDYRLLARIISAESRGEPYEGQVAVGAVVLNRVKHASFPNSISGVVYQPGAFTAIVDGQIDQPVAESSYRAARDAINGWDPSGGALYYFNPDKTSNKWMRTRPVIKRIGEHLFCS